MSTQFDPNANTSANLERDCYADLVPANATSVLSPSVSNSTHIAVNSQLQHPPNLLTVSSNQQSESVSVAEAVVKMLEEMGVKHAFGVSGGGMAPLWVALQHSSIQVLHFRHEAGAAFAAIECYFTSGYPVVVFTTTGPGITNALTGLLAARWEGAKVILLSASTSATQRGRWATQETSTHTMPDAGIFTSGNLFHYATTLDCNEQLPAIARRLAFGFKRPNGFVAHLSIPTVIQTSLLKVSLPQLTCSKDVAIASQETLLECVRLLSEGPFAIWVGFGARKAAAAIRQLAEMTGSAVMCSPRGKGIFPEDHPQFIGVTGFAAPASVATYMKNQRPARTLVLGTRLSEATSIWNPVMIPSRGFIHVDIEPEVPGTAYPSTETFAVQSDIDMFVKGLLHYFVPGVKSTNLSLPRPESIVVKPQMSGLVRPEMLMDAIQRVIVEGSDVVVMAEAGNAFAWTTHLLRFTQPGRYRISTAVGAMGHTVTGVVGAALGRRGKAVAIVGDGAMLMNSEVSTAVQYQVSAVWIVLNDACYNMCEQGMTLQGFNGVESKFPIPQTDFVAIARGMGADGIRVESEREVQAALEKALVATVPFVVDVQIDPTRTAPIGSRVQSLIAQRSAESKGVLF